MEHTVTWLENFTNRIIPFLVLAILVILLIDNPLWTIFDLHAYAFWLDVFDAVILVFFMIDLFFKWQHVRKLKLFVKLYWLDILAVFPIYLLFRLYQDGLLFFRTGEEVAAAQKVTHEALFLKESRTLGELSEESRLLRGTESGSRLIKEIQRLFRLIKGRFVIAHHAVHHTSAMQKQAPAP